VIYTGKEPAFLGYERHWQNVIKIAFIPFVVVLLLLGTQLPQFFSKHNLYEPFFLLVVMVPGAAIWLGTYPFRPAKRPQFKTAGDVLGLSGIVCGCASFVAWSMIRDEIDAFSASAALAGAAAFGLIFGGAFYRRSMVKKDSSLRQRQ
jgi:drug/metabolite transporter (DMT)-like permease